MKKPKVKVLVRYSQDDCSWEVIIETKLDNETVIVGRFETHKVANEYANPIRAALKRTVRKDFYSPVESKINERR